MATPNFNANLNTEISRLSDFSFGLPAEGSRRLESAKSQPAYRSGSKRPGRSTAGDVLVSLVILAAAVLGCFGMNSEMVVHYFPQVAAVLHLATPPQKPAMGPSTDAHIKVWVDLKTALYYCPGSTFYGQTRSGRFMSQSDAQWENFEPAQRRACTISPGALVGQARVARR